MRTLIITTIFYLGMLSLLAGCGAKPFGEDTSLKMLKKSGDDLSKPHVAQYEFHFRTKGLADSAAKCLKSEGMDIEIFEPDGSEWYCLVTKTIAPKLELLKKMTADMNEVAEKYGGRFDGWGLRPQEFSK